MIRDGEVYFGKYGHRHGEFFALGCPACLQSSPAHHLTWAIEKEKRVA